MIIKIVVYYVCHVWLVLRFRLAPAFCFDSTWSVGGTSASPTTGSPDLEAANTTLSAYSRHSDTDGKNGSILPSCTKLLLPSHAACTHITSNPWPIAVCNARLNVLSICSAGPTQIESDRCTQKTKTARILFIAATLPRFSTCCAARLLTASGNKAMPIRCFASVSLPTSSINPIVTLFTSTNASGRLSWPDNNMSTRLLGSVLYTLLTSVRMLL
mmetsp:Transcript_19995/g.34388  ORF Transcript_19995/g.34388 Transcript_19995/m.34388 type:complete len:215 (+) Transcript_19995:1047-1691(+)